MKDKLELAVAADAASLLERRKRLIVAIAEKFTRDTAWTLVIASPLDRATHRFIQESNFLYLTDLSAPGLVFTLDYEGKTTLYVPNFQPGCERWSTSIINPEGPSAAVGVDKIRPLGDECGCSLMNIVSDCAYVSQLVDDLKQFDGIILTCSSGAAEYWDQRALVRFITEECAKLSNVTDVSDVLAGLRAVKDKPEIDRLYRAVDCTIDAHLGAMQAIGAGRSEYEIVAAMEYVISSLGMQSAFPAIVAAGPDSLVLHYEGGPRKLENGQLVLVDAGARYEGYCADISRVYPVSGTFTPEQLKVYGDVLECQDHLAEVAKPGFWLNNPDVPKKSLNHIAVGFLEKRGYKGCMWHSVGHHLGLDVHDPSDKCGRLEEGSVFTLEPAVYLEKEGFGIRLEDEYWMLNTGPICLSEDLPKTPEDIETAMTKIREEGAKD